MHIQLLRITGQHLDPAIGVRLRVNKHPTSVVVRPERIRHDALIQRGSVHLQRGGARALLAVVDEPGKGAAATHAREEGQFAIADDLHGFVADFELAAPTAVVSAGAEAEVGATAAHKLLNATVAGAVERATVPQVGAAGEDEEGAGERPGLVDEHVGGDRDHGIVGGEETAEGVEAVTDGVDGGSIAWR